MDTDDQCTALLMDEKTYRLAKTYPYSTIKESIENTITPFKELLQQLSTQVYKYLVPKTQNIERQDYTVYQKSIIYLPSTHETHRSPVLLSVSTICLFH